ncbi:MAG TPA: hypothetical protein VEQ42_01065 [Pyrinomonadaceae bacterium]|nr:hypothetical protein [Pyrinomonadaceae bacterium]
MSTATANHLPMTPLGAGDLIDRTIRLYRQHFLALVRASAPPVVVSIAGAVLLTVSSRAISETQSFERLLFYLALAAFAVLLTFAGFVLQLVVMGGASYTLVRHLLWGEAVTTRAIYRSVRSRFWALLLVAVLSVVWFAVAATAALFVLYVVVIVVVLAGVIVGTAARTGGQFMVWAAAVFGTVGIVGAIVLSLWLFFLLAGRAAYVPQVLLVEGRSVSDAVSRSLSLASGNVRRLMAMFLFTTFATYSAMMLLLIPLGWYGYLQGVNPFVLNETEWPVWYAISYQVVTQSSTILLTPVWMLGLSLLYLNERVHREGYDIELLAARAFGHMPAAADGRAVPLTPAIAPEAAPQPATAGADSFNNSVLGL